MMRKMRNNGEWKIENGELKRWEEPNNFQFLIINSQFNKGGIGYEF